MNIQERFVAPSAGHLFGTDDYGRDMFVRILYGTRYSLLLGIGAVAISTAIGVTIGSFAGFYGGLVDDVIMRICDILASIPSLLLGMCIMTILGQSLPNLLIAVGIPGIPSFARIARGEMLRLKGLQFVQSAKLSKAGHARIIFAHIMPNAYINILASAAVGFNNAVIAEAGLSFLGLGVQPPNASLGRMINEAGSFLMQAPWYAVFPGVTIIILVLGVALISDGISKIDN